MLHAMILGIVGLVVSLVGAIVTWNKDRPSDPTGILSRLSCSRCRNPGRAASSVSCNCAHAWMADRKVRAAHQAGDEDAVLRR